VATEHGAEVLADEEVELIRSEITAYEVLDKT